MNSATLDHDITPAFGRHYHGLHPPESMKSAHRHGHIEANWLIGGRMVYIIEGERVEVPQETLTIFWADIPHQAIEVIPTGNEPVMMQIIDLPLDAFLSMQNISEIRNALLTGAMITMGPESCNIDIIRRWHDDYNSGDPDRLECMKMEYNAMLRRLKIEEVTFLRKPWDTQVEKNFPTASNMHHVVGMIRAVTERIGQPISTPEIAAVTGLHRNYGANLFSKCMHVSLKQFILRMQLVHARQKLIETDFHMDRVAHEAGFNSMTQFHFQFRKMYGISPAELRNNFFRSNPGSAIG